MVLMLRTSGGREFRASEGPRSLDKQEEGESRSKDLSVQEGCVDVKEQGGGRLQTLEAE